MANEYLYVLPLSLFILIPVTLLITYTMSVRYDHVQPSYPYISETGTSLPESCIFGQFLNIAAALLACCIYIRHRQVEKWRSERGQNLVNDKIIMLTVCSGGLSCIGLDVLANFQSKGVLTAHMSGAITCFTAGTVYFCLQAYLTQKMTTGVNGWIIVWIRSFLAALCIVLTIMVIIPGCIAMAKFSGSNYYANRNPSHAGWGWHVTSAVSEWTLTIVYCAFLLTFVPDFQSINFETPDVTLSYRDGERCPSTSSQTRETTVEEV